MVEVVGQKLNGEKRPKFLSIPSPWLSSFADRLWAQSKLRCITAGGGVVLPRSIGYLVHIEKCISCFTVCA